MRKNVMAGRVVLVSVLALVLTLAAMAFGPSAGAQSPDGGAVTAAPVEPSPPKALPGLGLTREKSGSDVADRKPEAGGVWVWLVRTQQKINLALTSAVRDLKQTGSMASAGMLAFLSFAYGVLHAAGPGHGKAVISSYVLANEKTVRRGIMLSFLAAMIQAVSAITIVGVLYGILQTTSMQMRVAEAWIETLSWALVAGVGAWLLKRQIQKLNHSKGVVTAPAMAHTHTPHHGHGAACGCDDHSHAHNQPVVAVAHDHDHELSADGTCAHCGHAHMPDPRQLDGELSLRKALAIAFAVGIRPCTGAILLLVFALSQGMLWAGVFATFAMAIGTAITVSALAALAVGSRELAQRMAGDEGGWGRRIEMAVGLAGSAAVFLMGAVFFIASLKGPPPL